MSVSHWRVALFLIWTLVLSIGPALRHFDIPSRPSWHMYRGYASGWCVMDVFERSEAGNLLEIERLDVLGYAGKHWAAPASVRRLKDQTAADNVVRSLCRKHGGPLFIDVRCGIAGKWHQRRTPEHDACLAK